MALRIVTLLAVVISLTVAQEQCKVDFVFMVDGSGSICNNRGLCENWNTIRTFIIEIVKELDVGEDGSRVGMITFGSKAILEWDLTKYTHFSELENKIADLHYLDETTFTFDALDMARTRIFGQNGDRAGVPNVALVLTDGVPSNRSSPFALGTTLTLEAADKLKQQDVNVIAIGVGSRDEIDPVLLKQISSEPQMKNENYFTSADFDQLKHLLVNIKRSACPATTPKPTTTTVSPIIGSCLLDLVFILDRSGSICNNEGKGFDGCDNWKSVRNFVSEFVKKLPITDGSVRVAMVIFGSSATVTWQLSRYTNENDLVNAIQNIRYESETTNTPYALELTRTKVFGMSDDRPNVDNIAIMLTDGNPSNGEAGRKDAIKQAQLLSDSGTKIITIGVTRSIQEDLLKEMSTNKVLNKDYFTSPDFNDLNTITHDVLFGTCKNTEPTCESRDIVFVLDSSGSIREHNFQKAKSFLGSLVKDLDIGGLTRVGLITFGDNVQLQFQLNSINSVEGMQDNINRVPYSHGTTNTADALKYVRTDMFTSENGDRSGNDDLVIIFTDGGSDNHESTITEALRLKAMGIHILVVGIGNWLQKYELQSIASHPDEKNIKYINSYDDLSNHVDFFRSYNCKRSNPCDSSPCRNGGTCSNKVDGEYYCKCASNYGGKDCDYRCEDPKDVVFAIDASGSITRDNFKLLVEFAKSVVLELPVDSNTRIGYETFSDDVTEYFNLRDYQDRSLIVNQMSIPYFMDGTTNTYRALMNMKDSMFTRNNGDQSDVPNIGIVVTDGKSNEPLKTWDAAKQLRSSGTELIAVGVSRSADMSELRAIASSPNHVQGKTPNVLQVDNFEDLQSIVLSTRDVICRKVDYCNPNPCNSGSCKSLTDGYRCECPSGRTGNKCERNCEGKADVVFVIDNSGSIRRERFDEVKEYLISIVENLDVDSGAVNVGAVKFADDASVVFGLQGAARQDIVYQMRSLSYDGGKTNIASALRTARQEVFSRNNDRSDAKNYLILFTDGTANIKTLETIPEAIQARIAGIHIIVVGVGKDLNQVEMAGIASYPASKNVITRDFFRDIDSMKQPVIDATCNSENECNSVSCRNQGTCKDQLQDYKCECRSDYAGKTCDRRCTQSNDVVFILDLSGSVDTTYEASVSFLRETILGLPFGFSSTRVSVITFADNANVAFSLDRYSSQSDILNALAFYQAGGKTNTQEALSQARSQIERYGRGGVKRQVILLTDGGSNLQRDQTIPNANRLKDDRDTKVHVVAIGEYVDQGEVQDITSDTVYNMADANDAKDTANRVLDNIC